METFLIDVPMPSMGATVSELTVIDIKVTPGVAITKGEKIAELESDKSVFEYEAPCDGHIVAVRCRAGDIVPSNGPFLRISTSDVAMKHLEVPPGHAVPEQVAASKPSSVVQPKASNSVPTSSDAVKASAAAQPSVIPPHARPMSPTPRV